jgi:ribosomal protein S27AE
MLFPSVGTAACAGKSFFSMFTLRTAASAGNVISQFRDCGMCGKNAFLNFHSRDCGKCGKCDFSV